MEKLNAFSHAEMQDRKTAMANKGGEISKLESDVWTELTKKFYWRSWAPLSRILEKYSGHFSQEDLHRVSDTSVEQAMLGERVASRVPLYSDVLGVRLSPDDRQSNPLQHLVSEQQLIEAVNEGFWHCLIATGNSEKQSSAVNELERIMGYRKFYSFFDFGKGVERAQEVVDNIDLERFGLLYDYLIWSLVQTSEIASHLEIDEAIEIKGRLVAPIINEVFSSKYGPEIEWRMLASSHFKGDLLQTEAIQKVMGKLFDRGLNDVWGRYGDVDHSHVLRLGKFLPDAKERAEKVWEQAHRDVRVIEKEGASYIPRSAFQSFVEQARADVKAMEKFDIDVFNGWMSYSIANATSASDHGRVRNAALRVYFEQKRRPPLKDLHRLNLGRGRLGNLDEKVSAYLAADFLRKESWQDANSIFIDYLGGNASYKVKESFGAGLQSYVDQHGRVKVKDKGLKPRICFPKFNMIPEVVERHERYFEVESSKKKA